MKSPSLTRDLGGSAMTESLRRRPSSISGFSDISRLLGFTSPCTISPSWMYASASATWSPIVKTVSAATGSRWWRAMFSTSSTVPAMRSMSSTCKPSGARCTYCRYPTMRSCRRRGRWRSSLSRASSAVTSRQFRRGLSRRTLAATAQPYQKARVTTPQRPLPSRCSSTSMHSVKASPRLRPAGNAAACRATPCGSGADVRWEGALMVAVGSGPWRAAARPGPTGWAPGSRRPRQAGGTAGVVTRSDEARPGGPRGWRHGRRGTRVARHVGGGGRLAVATAPCPWTWGAWVGGGAVLDAWRPRLLA